jgi:hypothetical protein
MNDLLLRGFLFGTTHSILLYKSQN